jgi:hypothetical protein
MGGLVAATRQEPELTVDHETQTDAAVAERRPDEQLREAGATRRRPSRVRLEVAIPWIVATIATAVAITLLLQLRSQPTEQVAAVEETAGRFALELTNWDATDGMGDTRDQLRAAGTDTFAADVDELFGGTDDLAELEEIGARSEGEVEDVLVESLDGDRAVALAVVVQRVSTELADGDEVSLRYARVDLAGDGGEWRVDGVELVVDELQDGGGSTPAPTGDDTEGEG